ncbi:MULTISPECIES: septal ring lytic transglycosylase RlpA family protein [Streptomyces rochei group]|uniref:Septal ring lytic transglycosylase RlpA family protein n=1 Tax=Streptomyces vinaceusdrappus TaxID=67376 RepID=A0ABY6BSL9_9ACTN|nr:MULTISPECIES: septal ring lytic transglycosylase RlpA family protein [Streptomyces rochei group]MCC8454290.1 septal ring lytic transglycosylase RlpA family protein [Streptomyces rochei]UXI78442.1 septal ring lytic transglycosylase RlpA family protein [Streptomyces vinaceusdrappus]
MSRRRTLGTKKKLALLVSAATVAGGGAFVMANASNAAQTAPNAQTRSAGDPSVCQGLATALGNNQRFIEGQRAAPDAQSEARIANREAVIAEIERKQEASGCVVGESAQDSPTAQPPQDGQEAEQDAGGGAGEQAGQEAGQGAGQQAGQGAGEQVCAGSTVTLSGEGGAPAASSNQFPVGTRLKVTNLDNAKSTTVEVASVSGSCVLLNNAAFEQVREEGKFLIRRALIEKVG